MTGMGYSQVQRYCDNKVTRIDLSVFRKNLYSIAQLQFKRFNKINKIEISHFESGK